MENDNDLENAVFKEKIKKLKGDKNGRININFNGIRGLKVKKSYLLKLKDPSGYINRLHFEKLDNRLKKALLSGAKLEDVGGLINFIYKSKGADYIEDLIRNYAIADDEYPIDEEGIDEAYDLTIPEVDLKEDSINIIKI